MQDAVFHFSHVISLLFEKKQVDHTLFGSFGRHISEAKFGFHAPVNINVLPRNPRISFGTPTFFKRKRGDFDTMAYKVIRIVLQTVYTPSNFNEYQNLYTDR